LNQCGSLTYDIEAVFTAAESAIREFHFQILFATTARHKRRLSGKF
jgi:hypothetical protein